MMSTRFTARLPVTGVRHAVLAALFAAVLSPATASAQDATMRAMVDRLNRLERQLGDLERFAYRGGQPPAPSTQGAAGTPEASPAPLSSGQLADAELRLSQMEDRLRGLTGQVEQVGHQIRQVSDRVDKLVRDVDFRLGEIEKQMRQGSGTMSQPAADGTAAAAPAQAGQDATGQGAAPAADDSAPPAGLPAGTPMEQYDYAYSLLRKLKLDEAEQAFKQFLAAHGDDKLAGNAQYWLGETYYTRGRLQDAARTFLEGVQKYPDSGKAADMLLKLGISLRRLDQVQEACATLGELARRFPNMDAGLKRRMLDERKTAACK